MEIFVNRTKSFFSSKSHNGEIVTLIPRATTYYSYCEPVFQKDGLIQAKICVPLDVGHDKDLIREQLYNMLMQEKYKQD
mgnify:CR=1 FL=1